MHCTLFFRDSGPCACSHIVSAGVSGTTLSQCQSNYAIDSIFRRVSFDIKKYRIAETRARGVDRSARAETHDANKVKDYKHLDRKRARPERSRIPDCAAQIALGRHASAAIIALTNTQITKEKAHNIYHNDQAITHVLRWMDSRALFPLQRHAHVSLKLNPSAASLDRAHGWRKGPLLRRLCPTLLTANSCSHLGDGFGRRRGRRHRHGRCLRLGRGFASARQPEARTCTRGVHTRGDAKPST